MSDLILTHLKTISGIHCVPDDWRYDSIGNSCNLGRGRVISQIEINSNPGFYPVYSSQTTNNGCMGYLATHDFEGEYATWTTDGANAGTVFYRKGKFNCTNVCGTIQPKSDKSIDIKFLTYHLNRISKYYVSYHGNPKLMNDVMANIAITFPPYKEQNAISTILETVDNTIQQTEAVIAKLKKVKAGMLHDLLTRGLDENGELRDPIRHPEQFKDSPLGKIPVEWEFNKLGSLIHTLETGVSVNAWDKPVGGGDIGILKTSCVHSGFFFPGKNKTVFPRDKGRVSCPVRCNSIIISRMNTPLLVGESGYIDQNFPNLYLPDRLWQLLLREEKIGSVKWLSYVLNWKPVRKSIRDIATGTSGSMKNISKGALLSIYITIPQPEEQCIIASRLNAFDELLRKETNELIKLQQCKQALMQDLLTGKVRVPEKLMEALP